MKTAESSLLFFPLPPFLFAELGLEPKSLMTFNLPLDQFFRRNTLFSKSSNFILRQEIRLIDLGIINKLVRLFDIVCSSGVFSVTEHRTYRQQRLL